MRLYLPIHLVGLALQSSSEEAKRLAETWDEYSALVEFRQVDGIFIYRVIREQIHPIQETRDSSCERW